MTNNSLPEGVKSIERIQKWYEYRDVRFYTVEIPDTRLSQWLHSDRTRKQYGYICISPRQVPSWNFDTPLKEIEDALHKSEDSRLEHIRKEVSYHKDPPFTENWHNPSWYILAGWDYQHEWNRVDEYEANIINDCKQQIDALYAENVLVSLQ